MVCHNDWIRHICEKKGVWANAIVFSFNPTTNTLVMGATTWGDVACYVVKGTIWRFSNGYKILEGGHGWKREYGFAPCVCNL